MASTWDEANKEGEQRLAQLRVESELKIEACFQPAKHSHLDRELEDESKGEDFISEKGIRGVETSGTEWGSLPLGTQLCEKLVIAAESASQIPALSEGTSTIVGAAVAKKIEKIRETVFALHRIEFTRDKKRGTRIASRKKCRYTIYRNTRITKKGQMTLLLEWVM